jgi:hypothetical protein
MSYECTVYTSGASSAVCTQSLGGAAANDPGVVTTTLTGSEIQFYPATVTAGLEKLSATVSGTKALSTGTAKTSGSSSSGSLITLTGTGAASGSASKTGAGASATTSSSGARRVELGAASGVGMVIVLGFALL